MDTIHQQCKASSKAITDLHTHKHSCAISKPITTTIKDMQHVQTWQMPRTKTTCCECNQLQRRWQGSSIVPDVQAQPPQVLDYRLCSKTAMWISTPGVIIKPPTKMQRLWIDTCTTMCVALQQCYTTTSGLVRQRQEHALCDKAEL